MGGGQRHETTPPGLGPDFYLWWCPEWGANNTWPPPWPWPQLRPWVTPGGGWGRPDIMWHPHWGLGPDLDFGWPLVGGLGAWYHVRSSPSLSSNFDLGWPPGGRRGGKATLPPCPLVWAPTLTSGDLGGGHHVTLPFPPLVPPIWAPTLTSGYPGGRMRDPFILSFVFF